MKKKYYIIFKIQTSHTVVLWLICRHRYSYLGNSTYLKVILTKNLTFITIIYHSKFQFAKISRTMKKKCNFLNFCDFYVLRNGKISQGSRNFCKMKLCMVNNSDKSKVFLLKRLSSRWSSLCPYVGIWAKQSKQINACATQKNSTVFLLSGWEGGSDRIPKCADLI